MLKFSASNVKFAGTARKTRAEFDEALRFYATFSSRKEDLRAVFARVLVFYHGIHGMHGARVRGLKTTNGRKCEKVGGEVVVVVEPGNAWLGLDFLTENGHEWAAGLGKVFSVCS